MKGFPLLPLLQRTGYILLLLGVPLGLHQIVRHYYPIWSSAITTAGMAGLFCCTSLLVFTAVNVTRPWWGFLVVVGFSSGYWRPALVL